MSERQASLPAIPVPNLRLQAGVKVLAVFAAAGFLYVMNPTETLGWAQCPFHAMTGLHCPGCGTLRALHALLHGRIIEALGLNVLTMSVLPFLAYPFISNVVMLVRGRGLPRVRVPMFLQVALIAAIFVFWGLRNIPVYPFTILAP